MAKQKKGLTQETTDNKTQENTVEFTSNNPSNTKNNTIPPTKSPKSKIKQKQSENTPKKLTLSEISKLAKEAQKYKEISLLNGRYKLSVHENFLDNDIHNFILDIQDALLILKSQNVNMKDVSNYFIIYQMLILKWFSDAGLKHLKMDRKKDINKILDVAEELLKIGVFQQIGEMFDPNEIGKINRAVENMDGIGKQLGELMIGATLSEQEKMRELGLEFVGTNESEANDGNAISYENTDRFERTTRVDENANI